MSATGRSGGGGSAVPAALFLAVMTVCTVLFVTRPLSAEGGAAYLGACLTAAGAIVWGIRHHRPVPRLPWVLLALAPVVGAVGMALRLRPADATGVARLLPDLVTIPAYLVFVAAVLALLRARRGSNAGSAVDGGLMAVAALLLSWAVLIRPVLADASIDLPLKVVTGTYPTLSVVVLFVGTLLAMTEVRGIPAFWGMAGGFVALLAGDVAYALNAAAGDPTAPDATGNAAYCVSFGLFGLAGLHPSMALLVRPARAEVRGYGHGRFAAVAVALLVPTAVVAIRPPDSLSERAVAAALLGVLGVLVLVRTATAVNRHAESERRLARQAAVDPLTGLPNRFRLLQHLDEVLAERAVDPTRGVGVLFLDLDQFKQVNDTWGHPVGDELLTVVGRRLREQVRDGELVARVGGDEFVVVVGDLTTSGDAERVARRLLTAFDRRIQLPATQVGMSGSVGIALAPPGAEPFAAQDLLRDADTALYQAKGTPGSSYAVFDESMRTALAERVALEHDLRTALESGELSLAYQPIVDLRTGRTTGFEALMRWTHPGRGPVGPDVFIPVAEATGLVTEMGRWAILEATGRLREWSAQFAGPLSMSVNLSPRQLGDPELVPTVARALASMPLPPASLALEITETSLLEDAVGTTQTVMALKSLGVRLSADDFGTGYSSLAYLRRIPFDQVKIDRSFVAGVTAGGDDEVIVGAVLSMARSLSLTTVAEGVETAEQRERLRALGADSAQGWHFARPLTAEQVVEHLAAQRERRPTVAA